MTDAASHSTHVRGFSQCCKSLIKVGHTCRFRPTVDGHNNKPFPCVCVCTFFSFFFFCTIIIRWIVSDAYKGQIPGLYWAVFYLTEIVFWNCLTREINVLSLFHYVYTGDDSLFKEFLDMFCFCLYYTYWKRQEISWSRCIILYEFIASICQQE